MQRDTAARKRAALAMLASGATLGAICSHPDVGCKRHKIRQWKDTDERFRAQWNELMKMHGRDVTDGGRVTGRRTDEVV